MIEINRNGVKAKLGDLFPVKTGMRVGFYELEDGSVCLEACHFTPLGGYHICEGKNGLFVDREGDPDRKCKGLWNVKFVSDIP